MDNVVAAYAISVRPCYIISGAAPREVSAARFGVKRALVDDSITPNRQEHGIRKETGEDVAGGLRRNRPTEGAATSVVSKASVVLLCVVLSCPLSCVFFGPVTSVLCRLITGTWPIGDPNKAPIHDGMTRDEVKAALGEPHARYSEVGGGERWYYYLDGLGIGYLGIDFNAEGVVTGTST